jgi:hypothetical protein
MYHASRKAYTHLLDNVKISYALQYVNEQGFGFTAAASVIGGRTVELALRWRDAQQSEEPDLATLNVYTMSYEAAEKLIAIITAALDEIDAAEEGNAKNPARDWSVISALAASFGLLMYQAAPFFAAQGVPFIS